MARFFDADSAKGLHDPITFRVNGKTYEVRELTDELMEAVQEVASEDTSKLNAVLTRQLAVFTGAEESEFLEVPIRTKTAILNHITEATTDPLGRRAGGPRR